MSVLLGDRQVRVIDCHCHLGPIGWRTPAAPACMFDVEGVIEEHRAGVDVSVFGNNWIRIPASMSPLDTIRRYNDFAAELTARYSGHLLGLASTVPYGNDEYLQGVGASDPAAGP